MTGLQKAIYKHLTDLLDAEYGKHNGLYIAVPSYIFDLFKNYPALSDGRLYVGSIYINGNRHLQSYGDSFGY